MTRKKKKNSIYCNLLYILEAIGQFCNTCNVFSTERMHTWHNAEVPKCQQHQSSAVNRLSCMASHKNIHIFCGPDHSHTFNHFASILKVGVGLRDLYADLMENFPELDTFHKIKSSSWFCWGGRMAAMWRSTSCRSKCLSMSQFHSPDRVT